jgi:fructose-bisphosphate aldolase / 2-amino-3,7-dideoxy-D-threo-hept-6-ulosonate synthase
MSGSGKHRRLERLRTPEGSYLWLAMDHGLTYGQLEGLTDLRTSLALAASTQVTGVVVNRGIAMKLPPTVRAGLVLQTFGRPSSGAQAESKVATCRVDDALRLAADAVSVQMDLNASGLSHAIHAISLMISDAAAYEIPVLLMATASKDGDPFEAVANALRICTELGADLIKISLPVEAASADADRLASVREAVLHSSPVLLGGGERRDDLIDRLSLARSIGFSGACIGRSVFQDPEPTAVLAAIRAVVDGLPPGLGASARVGS